MEDRLIVFAPGWGDPHMIIDRLAKRFDNGFDRLVLTYTNRGTNTSIPEMADALLPVLSCVRDSYSHVSFVGHSMGGLIGRELLSQYDEPETSLFDAYISVATPHQGTGLAKLAPTSFVRRFSASGADMRPGSDFLNNLPPVEIPSLTLRAQFDELLWPQHSAHLDGSTEVTIPWTNHVRIATSFRTFGEIWGWLVYNQLGTTEAEWEEGHLSKVSPE